MPKLAQFHVTWLISTTLLMLPIFTIVLKLLPTTSTVNAQLNTKLNGLYGLRDTTTHSSAQLMNARQVTTHAMPMPSASIKPKDMTVSAKLTTKAMVTTHVLQSTGVLDQLFATHTPTVSVELTVSDTLVNVMLDIVARNVSQTIHATPTMEVVTNTPTASQLSLATTSTMSANVKSDIMALARFAHQSIHVNITIVMPTLIVFHMPT